MRRLSLKAERGGEAKPPFAERGCVVLDQPPRGKNTPRQRIYESCGGWGGLCEVGFEGDPKMFDRVEVGGIGGQKQRIPELYQLRSTPLAFLIQLTIRSRKSRPYAFITCLPQTV